MKLLGHSVFWSIADDVVLTPEHLTKAGFEREIPRNEPKTALIKACKVIKKSWAITDAAIGATIDTPKVLKKADHRRFKDNTTECRIALTRPRIDEDGSFSIETALVITLKKGSSELEFENVRLDAHEFHDLENRIRQAYEEARGTIDATQFRLLVARKVTGTCRAVSLRAFSGGIYLVAERNTDKLMQVKKLFEGLDLTKAVFEAFPLYDDGSAVADSINRHVTVAMEKEINKFITDLNDEVRSGMSKRALEGRIGSAEEIKTKLADYGEHLRKRLDEFVSKTSRMIGVLDSKIADAKGKTVEPFDLLAELAAIDSTMNELRGFR
jgi:hypothetical protein